MKDVQENKLSMALVVKTVMDDNNALWNGIPAMVTAKGNLDAKIADVQFIRAIQEAGISGITIDKRDLKLEAVNKALPVIGGLKAFAIANSNNELLERINYSRTELFRVRDTVSADRMKIVRDEGNNNLAALADYNVTSAMVADLSGSIAAFELLIPRPRVALNIRKNATESLVLRFREMDGILNVMDGLIETLSEGQPVFYETYQNARIIVDIGKTGGGLKGTVTDDTSGIVLEGVRVELPESGKVSFTNGDGNYHFLKLKPGRYRVTASKEGYVTLDAEAVIEENKIRDLDLRLVRV
jgi:hypothetical protein